MKLENILGEQILSHLRHEITKISNAQVLGLAFDMSWHESVSNTHSAPRGGVTNWGGRETFSDGSPKPTGYPGWSGRVWVRYSGHRRNGCYLGSDPFSGSGMHTGTGGWGAYNGPWQPACTAYHKLRLHNNRKYSRKVRGIQEPVCYSWDCRAYASDFPELLEAFNMERAMLKLQGTGSLPTFDFEYTDVETQLQDHSMIAKWKELSTAEPA